MGDHKDTWFHVAGHLKSKRFNFGIVVIAHSPLKLADVMPDPPPRIASRSNRKSYSGDSRHGRSEASRHGAAAEGLHDLSAVIDFLRRRASPQLHALGGIIAGFLPLRNSQGVQKFWERKTSETEQTDCARYSLVADRHPNSDHCSALSLPRHLNSQLLRPARVTGGTASRNTNGDRVTRAMSMLYRPAIGLRTNN